jgi:hypothetical protein
LVRSVLTAIAIYHITALSIPVEVLLAIDKIRRAFLWVVSDKVSGGKCKINWTSVCHPLGGLGILHLQKFVRALRLRWPWLEWEAPERTWVGTGNPCDEKDMDLFHALTKVTIGDGNRASFWDSSWVDGLRPKHIAPLIFDISRSKNWCVRMGVQNDAWVSKINTANGLTVEHIQQFISLWTRVSQVTFQEGQHDTIIWKLTTSGRYSAASAYKAQFAGTTTIGYMGMVWEIWAPPKCKFFAWLILQNRVWTADCLATCGWPNCGNCPLCNSVPESAAHLLFQCTFSISLWTMVKDWFQLQDFHPDAWQGFQDVKAWWFAIVHDGLGRRKAMASLTMLVVWELWNERNARIFNNKSATPTIVMSKIRCEAKSWGIAGATHLCNIMPGE